MSPSKDEVLQSLEVAMERAGGAASPLTALVMAMMSPGAARAYHEVFEGVRMAEEEIDKAQAKWPEHEALLERTFMLLEIPAMMRGKHEALFRHHCQELLQRVVENEDLRPATKAEVLALLCETYDKAPLTTDAGTLYALLFKEIIPMPEGWDDNLRVAPRESYPGATTDTLAWARRKYKSGRPKKLSDLQKQRELPGL